MIKSWFDLNIKQKEKAFDFIISNSTSLYHRDNDERKKYLTGSTFSKGKNLLFYLSDSKFWGSIGIVTSEINLRGETYITEINILDNSQNIFKELLGEAVAICKKAGSEIITLGLKPHNFFLSEIVIDSNFIYAHSFIKMTHDKKKETKYNNLIPLNKDNASSFAEIMTSSFINSPNGGSISTEEAYELLGDPDSSKYGLIQIDDEYVGVYELRISENKGWIGSIGISKSHQNRGYGKMLLNQSMGYLYSLGVDIIEMMVADSNIKAYELYIKTGFLKKEILSTWYKLSINN